MCAWVTRLFRPGGHESVKGLACETKLGLGLVRVSCVIKKWCNKILQRCVGVLVEVALARQRNERGF